MARRLRWRALAAARDGRARLSRTQLCRCLPDRRRADEGPLRGGRWFWIEPNFEGGARSALLHKQPDDIWRIDFQLGSEIDRAAELDRGRVRARIDAILGSDIEYDLVWTSIYTFHCRRLASFRAGRVLFAGDAAHQVSPFGARGANSRIQDADNLGWKLDLVGRNAAPKALLDSYFDERSAAADENILNSSRATDFLAPRSETATHFRDAVLSLAARHPFARPLVNSGRLSTPNIYDGHSLNGPDALGGPPETRPGAPCPDAPLGRGFLLDRLRGGGFTLLTIDAGLPDAPRVDGIALAPLAVSAAEDPSGRLAARYLGSASAAIYLIRPDQHVAARWPAYDAASLRAATARVLGRG